MMNQTANVQEGGTNRESAEELKRQIAEHLAQQPESIQAAHRWMKRLEAAAVGVIIAIFIAALYLSIMWKSVSPQMIAVAWFTFAASGGLYLIFYGLDAVILRAFPPARIPGNLPKFVTGSSAVRAGIGFMALALAMIAFWGVFAYATWTQNFALLKPLITLLGAAMGVGILVSMIQKTFSKLSK